MGDVSTALAFETLGEPPGVEVVDRIEQQRYSIFTPEPVSPTEIATDEFLFPVGRAIEFEGAEIRLPAVVTVVIHDEERNVLAELNHGQEITLPEGTYSIGLSTQIKSYVEVAAPLEVTAADNGTAIRFSEPTNVRLGIRSRHERPAETITTTRNPSDVMAAIETFGASLKTMDPERSYPTLRGHPPAVELGEELSIPDGLESPDNGITIELPLTVDALFAASPLSYYLGASLEVGQSPRIVTETGFEYALVGPRDFESTVARTLKQVFLFDCITRTEGLYQFPLAERERIEPVVDIDFASLYDKPVAEQIEAYLDVPFEVIEDHVPAWPLATHVEPNPSAVEQLPFVINDLSIVRTAKPTSQARTDRSHASAPTVNEDDVLFRSAAADDSGAEDSFVQPTTTDAMDQAWIGDDIPIGASKPTVSAFRNRLRREVREGDIEITIVLNDDRMDAERDLIDRVYGNRNNLPFEVNAHRETTTSQLRELLETPRDFLHYIGHTRKDGFECADGILDARTVDEVNVDSFLLNACNSYKQGLALIDAGAIGGIVTLADIINEEGVAMGETVARLLNAGFPLRVALSIAREESIQGGQYIVVGDGGVSVTQADGRTPNLMHIEREDEKATISIDTFATDEAPLGTLYTPHFSCADNYHLSSGNIGPFVVSDEELVDLLQMEDFPVRIDDELMWSGSITDCSSDETNLTG